MVAGPAGKPAGKRTKYLDVVEGERKTNPLMVSTPLLPAALLPEGNGRFVPRMTTKPSSAPPGVGLTEVIVTPG